MQEQTIPTTNEQLVKQYGRFVRQRVKQMDKVGRYQEDIVQHVWLHFFSTGFLEKFWATYQKPKQIITGEEAARTLGVYFYTWYMAQWKTARGEHHWGPTPIDPSANRCASDTEFTLESVLAVSSHFRPKLPKEVIMEQTQPTVAGFKSYLARSVLNTVKNFFRYLDRHHREYASFKAVEEEIAFRPSPMADPETRVILADILQRMDNPMEAINKLDKKTPSMSQRRKFLDVLDSDVV